jgi:N-acetylglucosamine-6-sulfatase
MISRRTVLGMGTAAFAAGNRALQFPVAGQEAPQPNFVIVLVDDLDTGLFEQAIEDLPAIRSLRDSGVNFTRFFSPTPLCSPARASLLRGQYAHNTGVLWNRGQAGGSGGFEAFHRMGREESTIATWLQDGGYRTGLVGKYLNSYPMGADPRHIPPGWDYWVSHPAEMRELFYFNYTMNENGEIVEYQSDPEDYSTDVIARHCLSFIEEAVESDQPFFLLATPYAPHDPAQPAIRHEAATVSGSLPQTPSLNEEDVTDKPEWLRDLPLVTDEEFGRITANYQQRIRTLLAVDELVGLIVQTLGERGQLDNTFVVFLSDNGFHYGEHRVKFGKVTPYDEATRIPLIISGPGVPAGVAVDSLAAMIDIAPTIGELAGLAVPEWVDGNSLVADLRGEGTEGRAWVLLEQFEVIAERTRGSDRERPQRKRPVRGTPMPMADATPTPARFIQANVPPFVALRGEDTLYVEYATGERELYDLDVDPYALENIADDVDEARVADLSRIVMELADCTGERCREAATSPLLAD